MPSLLSPPSPRTSRLRLVNASPESLAPTRGRNDLSQWRISRTCDNLGEHLFPYWCRNSDLILDASFRILTPGFLSMHASNHAPAGCRFSRLPRPSCIRWRIIFNPGPVCSSAPFRMATLTSAPLSSALSLIIQAIVVKPHSEMSFQAHNSIHPRLLAAVAFPLLCCMIYLSSVDTRLSFLFSFFSVSDRDARMAHLECTSECEFVTHGALEPGLHPTPPTYGKFWHCCERRSLTLGERLDD